MFLIIGNLEEPIKDNDNINYELIPRDENKTTLNNEKSKNKTETNVVRKVNFQLQKSKPTDNENKSINHININIINDTSNIINIVQILTMNKTIKKNILNPHLGKEKSYFVYKKTLKET